MPAGFSTSLSGSRVSTPRSLGRSCTKAFVPRAQASSDDVGGQAAPRANFALKACALTAILAAAPAVVPIIQQGGGGGNGGFLGGSGGGGGGGGSVFEHLLPYARADEDDDDDEDEDDDDDDGEDDDDEDAAETSETDAALEAAGKVVKEVPEEDEENEEDYMQPPKNVHKSAFYCAGVEAQGLPKGPGLPTAEELFAALNCQPGFWVPREKLQEDLKRLLQMGIFKEVDAKVVPARKLSKSKKMKVVFAFSENFWVPIKSFEVVGSKCLPPDINDQVMAELNKHHKGKPTGLAVLTSIRHIVEGWYVDRGFAYSYMKDFEGLETGNVRVSVCEPKIRSINIKFVNDAFEEKATGGATPVALIKRSISLKPGQFYSLHDGRTALQEAFGLQVFDNAQVQPDYAPNKDDQLDVSILLRERPMQTMDVEAEWGLAPRFKFLPLPLPVSPIPGGTLTFEDRNFQKKGNTLTASLMCPSFLHPSDDLSLKVGFRQPFVFGPRSDEDLVMEAFNTRRLSSVFASAPGEDVPPVWVERGGARVGLAEQLTRQSRSYAGLVLQEVKTRDDTGALVSRGMASGQQSAGAGDTGPLTTLGGSGVDRFVDLKFNVTRDTTYYTNGAIVGSRDIVDVTQGLGIGNGVFNRYMASLTRFIQLNKPKSTSTLPPATLVLHGKHGNCIGPLASYDYHVLGGPHSCRGYSLGELGPARSFVEGAVEVRLPVPVIKKQVYAFAETARDLGKAIDLIGNPREFYNRAGKGSSVGAGVKLGALRAELARDNNKGTSTWFVHFGERF